MTTPAPPQVPPPATPPPTSPPQAGDREDQAAITAAAVAVVFAAAEAAIIAAVAAAVHAEVTARHKLLHSALTATTKLGHRTSRLLGDAQRQALHIIRHAPHADSILAATVDGLLTRTARRTTANTVNSYQQIVTQALTNSGGSSGGGSGRPPRLALPGPPQDAYRKAVGHGIDTTRGGMPVSNTSYSALQAAQTALDDLADQGITGYTDRTGRKWSLSAYVEMATRTEISNRYDDLSMQTLAGSGIDTVWTYTDSSEGSCKRCLPWLNKALSISGGTDHVSVHLDDGTLFRRQVTGTLAEAKAAGFRHPACRCGLSGIYDGVNLGQLGHAAEPTAEAAKAYQASQEQRALERHVRDARRHAAAAVTPQAKRQARQRLTAATRASAQHRQATGSRMTQVAARRRESLRPPGGPHR